MKKRILSFLMAVCMGTAILPVMSASAAERKAFQDVPQDAWYSIYVYPLVDRGIIVGTDDAHFNPNAALDRASFMKLMVCSVMNASEFDAYKGLNLCPDVPSTHWSSGFVNWAAREGIIPAGENFRPGDAISRGEAAKIMYSLHKVHPEAAPLTSIKDPKNFPDIGNSDTELLNAVSACSMAGIIEGDNKGNFNPNGTTTRGAAAKLLCLMMSIEPLKQAEVPAPPAPSFAEPVFFSRNGASGVEFNPAVFNSKVVLANNKLDSAASNNDALRADAYIAVNGATFNINSKYIYGTLISNGKILRDLQAPANQTNKPCFVIDTNGKASIQWMSINQSISLTKDGKTYQEISNIRQNVNLAANDGSRMIYTTEYGATVSGTIRYGLCVDDNDRVTKIYTSPAENVPIPSSGYILVQRTERGYENDDVYKFAQVGDKIDRTIKYEGSSVQNIRTAISCGPTIVKDGNVYGDSTTYAQEGFDSSSNVVGKGAHILIGVKSNGNVVIASASGSQRSMGEIMKSLGCVNAMNMDGGASTYLYCNGKKIASPGRGLTNMLVFTKP